MNLEFQVALANDNQFQKPSGDPTESDENKDTQRKEAVAENVPTHGVFPDMNILAVKMEKSDNGEGLAESLSNLPASSQDKIQAFDGKNGKQAQGRKSKPKRELSVKRCAMLAWCGECSDFVEKHPWGDERTQHIQSSRLQDCFGNRDNYLDRIIEQMMSSERGLAMKKRKSGFMKLGKRQLCFSGRVLLDWLAENLHIMQRDHALELATLLMANGYIIPLTKKAQMDSEEVFFKFFAQPREVFSIFSPLSLSLSVCVCVCLRIIPEYGAGTRLWWEKWWGKRSCYSNDSSATEPCLKKHFWFINKPAMYCLESNWRYYNTDMRAFNRAVLPLILSLFFHWQDEQVGKRHQSFKNAKRRSLPSPLRPLNSSSNTEDQSSPERSPSSPSFLITVAPQSSVLVQDPSHVLPILFPSPPPPVDQPHAIYSDAGYGCCIEEKQTRVENEKLASSRTALLQGRRRKNKFTVDLQRLQTLTNNPLRTGRRFRRSQTVTIITSPSPDGFFSPPPQTTPK